MASTCCLVLGMIVFWLNGRSNIKHFFSDWIKQFSNYDPEDYLALRDELQNSDEYIKKLQVLDNDLKLATDICPDISQLISEKKKLPLNNSDEASRQILDKLSEIKAVIGLHRLGFSNIRFNKSPDFTAINNGLLFGIEVTRMNKPAGHRQDVFERSYYLNDNLMVNVSYSDGKDAEKLYFGIYNAISRKEKQLSKIEPAILWVSLGRDYLSAGKFEIPGIGTQLKFKFDNCNVISNVWDNLKKQNLLPKSLRHIVLSPGSDLADLVYPPLLIK